MSAHQPFHEKNRVCDLHVTALDWGHRIYAMTYYNHLLLGNSPNTSFPLPCNSLPEITQTKNFTFDFHFQIFFLFSITFLNSYGFQFSILTFQLGNLFIFSLNYLHLFFHNTHGSECFYISLSTFMALK